MKKFYLIICIISIGLVSCSSDKNDESVISNFTGVFDEFKPTSAKVTNSSDHLEGQTTLVFFLDNGKMNTDDYESITFKIKYPNKGKSPNGIFTFGKEDQTKKIVAQGEYNKRGDLYYLDGGAVNVIFLGNDRCKIELQTAATSGIIGSGGDGWMSVAFSLYGSYEGKFIKM